MVHRVFRVLSVIQGPLERRAFKDLWVHQARKVYRVHQGPKARRVLLVLLDLLVLKVSKVRPERRAFKVR